MEWLYGDFAACPDDLEATVNDGFIAIECPIDPATELPWYKTS